MGGTASRILDEVRTSRDDGEAAVAKIKHCMSGRRGDINYAGKVNTYNQNNKRLLTIEHCNNIRVETVNLPTFIEIHEEHDNLLRIRTNTATLCCHLPDGILTTSLKLLCLIIIIAYCPISAMFFIPHQSQIIQYICSY